MKSKKIGMVALALAMGTLVHAEDSASNANHHAEEISSVKNLVDSLEQSADSEEYEAKLETIKAMLDNMSKEEVMEYQSSVVRCASPN